MSYRNKQSTNDVRKEKFVRYSIRKLGNYGAASVAVAAGFFFLGGGTAQASEIQEAAIVHQAQSSETPEKQGDTTSVQPEAEATATPVNKEALTQLVSELKGLDVTTKTEQSLAVFQASLTQAETLLTQETATQEQVDQAKQDLEAAHNQLVEKEVKQEEGSEEGKKEVATPPAAVAPTTPAETDKKLVTKSFSVKPATPEEIEATRNPQKPTETPALEAGSGFRDTPESAVEAATSVQFKDPSTGQIIADPATYILNAGTGASFPVTLIIKAPQEVKNKKVTVTLGNFLSFQDTGVNDALVKEAKITATPQRALENFLLAEDGVTKYKNIHTPTTDARFNNKYQVVYTFPSGAGIPDVTSIEIPVVLTAHYNSRIIGIAKSGTLPNLANRVEESTPITVTISGQTSDGQAVTKTATLDNISMQAASVGRYATSGVNGFGIGVAQNATSANDFTSIVTLETVARENTAQSVLIESEQFDLVLPKGVNYIGLVTDHPTLESRSGTVLEQVGNPTPTNDGGTRITFRNNVPRFGKNSRYLFELKVDREVISDDYAERSFRIENHTENLRNNETGKAIGKSGTLRIFNIKAGEEMIGYSADANAPLRTGYTYTGNVFTLKSDDTHHYISLAGPQQAGSNLIYNFGETTGQKEMHYTFPENEYVDVKGVRIPLLTNQHPISSVKVKTKKSLETSNEWVVKPLPRTLVSGETRWTLPAEFIDVKSLGLDDDDVLREVIFEIGVLEGNTGYSYADNEQNKASIVGLTKKEVTNNQAIHTASVVIRDKDYDEQDPTKNKALPTVQYHTRFVSRGDVKITPQTSTTIPYGANQRIRYTIVANDAGNSHWGVSTTPVKNIFVVLPENVEVKSFRLINFEELRLPNNGAKDPDFDFSQQVKPVKEIRDGKAIYTINMDNVDQSLNKSWNWIGQVWDGTRFDMRKALYLDVELSNFVEEATTVPMQHSLFVETAHKTSHYAAGSAIDDKYNLKTLGGTMYGIPSSQSVVTLTKADQLTLKTDAKLSSDSSYSNASGTDTFTVKDTSQKVDLRFTIANETQSEIGAIDMVIPIAKEGQNWGSYFKTGEFPYSFTLENMTPDSPDFATYFGLSYANVALDGSNKTLDEVIATSQWLASPLGANAIRVTSKENVQVPANKTFNIVASMRLGDMGAQHDGKVVTFTPQYKAKYGINELVQEGNPVAVEVALSRFAIDAFVDTDGNGKQNGTEARHTPLNYQVTRVKTGKVVEQGTTNPSDKTIVKGLVASEDYTIRITNPDVSTNRFTTGTVSTDKSYTEHSVTAQFVTSDAGLNVDSNGFIGLTQTKTTTNFTADTAKGTVAASTQGFFDDKITVPDVTPKPGNQFVGWKQEGTTAVVRTATVAEQLYGKEAKTYAAQFLTDPVATSVEDKANLKPTDLERIKQAVQTANPEILPAAITVDATGKVTVNFGGGINVDIPAATAVTERAKTATPLVNAIDSDDVKITGTGVEGAKVTVRIEGQPNKEATVRDGLWEVATAPLPSGTVVKATQKVDGQKESAEESLTVAKTAAESAALTPPTTKVNVIDSTDVSPEADQIKDAIIAANPSANLTKDRIKVDPDGTVTVTFPADGSKTVFAPSETIQQLGASQAPQVNPVDSDDETITGSNAVPNSTITAILPNGTRLETTVETDGTWSIKLGKPVETGTIKVTAKEPGKPVSPATNLPVTVLEKTAKPTVDPIKALATTITGTGVNGAEVTAQFPDGGVVQTRVKDGRWSIAVPASETLNSQEAVKVSQKLENQGRSDVVSATVEASQAESTPVNWPTTKVLVNDPANITPTEAAAINKAVKDANPTLDVTVANGEVTVRFPDGSSTPKPVSDFVEQKDASAKKDTITKAVDTAVAGIDRRTDLTNEEKEKAKEAVRNAGDAAKANVDKATTQADIDKAVSDGAKAVTAAVPGATGTAKDSAKKAIDATATEQIRAVNANPALTEQEKAAAIASINKAKDATKANVDKATTGKGVQDALINGTVELKRPVTPVAKPTAIKAIEDAAAEKERAISTDPTLTDEEKAAAIDKVKEEAGKAKTAVNDATTTDAVNSEKGKGATAIAAVPTAPAKKPGAKAEIDTAKDTAIDAVRNNPALTDEEKAAAVEAINKLADSAKANVDAATTNSAVDQAKNNGIDLIDNPIAGKTKDQAKELIDTKAADAIREINARPDLTDEEKAKAVGAVNTAKDAAKSAINDASNTAAVIAATATGTAAINTPVEAAKKPGAKAEIDAKADEAKKAIDARSDLTNEEKDAAKKVIDTKATEAKGKVDAASTDGAVTTAKDAGTANIGKVVTDTRPDAKDAAKNAINTAATAAKNTIDDRSDLTKEEKDAAKKVIDAKADEAKKAVDEAEANDAVNTAKENGTTAIDKVVTDTTPVAKPAAKAEIDAEAEKAKNAIDARSDLTAEEKKDAKDAIDTAADKAKKAVDAAEANAGVDAAKDDGKAAINTPVAAAAKPAAIKAVEDAAKAKKAEIDKQDSLTDEEKAIAKAGVDQVAADAKTAINNAPTNDAVGNAKDAGLTAIGKTVSATSKPEAKRKVQDAANAATKAIDARNDLTAEEKKDAKDAIAVAAANAAKAIDAATTSPEVLQAAVDGVTAINKPVAGSAKQAAKDAINAAKEAATKAIAANNALTAEEKANAVATIDAETTKALAAVDAAKDKAAVDAAKADGVQAVNTGVTNAQPAVKPAAVTAINAEAEKAKAAIDGRTDLTADEKDAAKKAVEAAAAKAIDAINAAGTNAGVEEAKANGISAINTPVTAAARPAAIKAIEDAAKAKKAEIDGRTDLTADEKDAAKKAVDNAVKDAKDAINAADTNPAVEDAKTNGISAINTPVEATVRPAAIKAVEDAAKAKKAEIDGRNDLTNEDKKAAKDGIDAIAAKAITAINASPTTDAVDEAKKAGISAINTPIDASTKDEAKKSIDNAAKAAKAAIDARGDLTTEEKGTAKAAIETAAGKAKKDVDAAGTNAAVLKATIDGVIAVNPVVVGTAKPTAKAEIDAKATEEKQAIEAHPELTAEEKQAAKEAIDQKADEAKQAIDTAEANADVEDATTAGKAAIEKAGQDALPVVKPAGKTAIDNAAKAAKEAIDARDDLTTEEKKTAKDAVDAKAKEAKAAVDAATTNAGVEAATTAGTKAITSVKDNTQAVAKPAAKAAIDAKATEEKAAIDARGDLTTEEKAAAKDAVDTAADKAKKAVDAAEANADVDAATTAGTKAITSVKDNTQAVAKPAAKAEIDAEAEKAKKAIDARGDLTTEEKATAKDAVDTAADKAKKAVDDAKANADVDTATDAGKAAIEKVVTDATPVAKPAAKAEIDAEAEKAKKAIDARGDLTAEEKKVAKDAVDVKATEAKKAVDKAAANADVEAATTAGKAAINTPVEAATKPAAIKAIEDAAKAKKADIDKQDSLTAEEKAIAKAGVDQVAADAKTAINNAPTDKAVEIAKQAGLEAIAQTVVATSKPEAKQKVQAAAKAATKAIDARNDLTDEEKKAAKDAIAEAAAKADKAIDAATTSPEVLQAAVNGITAINKPVAGSVKQAAKDAINAAKEIATKAIAAKDALTAEEKAKAVAAIEAAAQRALTAIDAAKGNNAVETAKQAGIQEIEAGVTNAQPAAKPAAVAAINAEADKVKAAIEKRTDLTDDEKDAAKKAVEAAAAKAIDAINAAGTNAGVETAKANGIVEINKPVVSSVKPNALAAIDAEAEKATQAIDARNDLTAEEKAAAKKAIKAAKDAAKKAINEATSDASVAEKETQGKAAINTPVEATVRPAAIKAVEDAAKAKKDAIDARSDLTNEDKKAAKDGIDAIVAKAVAAINASPTNDAVKAAKDAGIAAINTPIDATTKEAAKKTVTDAAQAAKNAIKGRSDLTTEEKDEAVALIDTETTNATDAIEAAGTNADVLKETIDGVIAVNPVVVGEVKPTAKDAIDAAADKAKKAIDARDDLTAEEKAAAKDTVDTKADEAKKAVDAAEANADVDAAKDLGLAAIDKAVTDATPVAKPAAKAAIDAKAKEEKAAIDARNDLTAEEKAAAKDQIEAAATAAKDAVDAATTDASVDAAKDAGLAAITAVKDNTQAVAKPTAQAAIDAKADEAKKAIDARGDLTTEEKAAAKAEIDAEAEKAKKAVDDAEANADVEDATTAGLAAIDKVVTDATPDAKPAAKAEIDAKAKEEKAAIDARGDLTTEEKATAKDAVDTAADKAKKAVDDAEANADVEDATTAGKAAIEKAGQDAFPVVKPAAKAEIDAEAEKAKKAIDARGDLTTEEKATAKDAVDTAADKAKKAVDAAEANADVDAAKDAGLAAIEKAGQAALPVVKPAGKTAIDNAAKAAKEAIDARGDLTAEEKKTAKDAVDTAADKAKKAVDAATTNAGVEAATTAGKAAIEKAGQAALPVVKPAAKAEIDAKAKEEKAAIDARSDLTAEEKKAAKDAIDTAADKAKKAVDAATTNAGVAAAKDAGKAAIDKVAKDAKPVAKDAAKDAIDAAADEAKKAIDARSDLTDEEKKAAKDAIDAAADKAKKAVDAATTNAGVSTAVEQGKATLDVIVKDAVKQAEKAAQQKQTGQKGKALPTTGEAPSSILGLALAGLFASAAILVKKRKEEE